MDFGRRRYCTYSAEKDLIDLKGVRCSESRTYVVGASDIVQHYNYT